MACKWILEKNEPAPMLFSDLMTLAIPDDIRLHIDNLLRIKMSNDESKEGNHIAEVDMYMENSMAAIKQQIQLLPKSQQSDWERLNNCFLSSIN